MTKTELNNAIKHMAKRIKDDTLDGFSAEAKSLFTTLAGADPDMYYMNRENIRAMFVLNRKYQYIKLSEFGPTEL